MRIRGIAVFALLAACGDDDAVTAACPDAGVVEAGPVDAGTPPPQRARVTGPELRTLLVGGNYTLIGVTTNFEPHAVYYQFNPDGSTDVAAVPVYGGAPIVLQKAIGDSDNAVVNGGAVAWYSNTGANGLATAISIWTPENGTKQITTRTSTTLFAANSDGSRVAFSANAEIDETPLVVTSSAAPNIEAPAFSGIHTLNLSSTAQQCIAALEFRGPTLFGSFCTGPAPDSDSAQLFSVGADNVAVERGNETSLKSGNIVFFDTDPSGKRIFVFTGDLRANLVTLDGAKTTVLSLGSVNDFRLLADGSGAVLLRDKTLSRVNDKTEIILATDATVLYGATRDSKVAFYGTTDPQAVATDLKSIDVNGGSSVALVATPTARFIDESGTSAHVIYRRDIVNDTGPLVAAPVLGGAEITLAPASFGANVAREGTSVIAITYASSVAGGQAFRATFAYTDIATAPAPLGLTTVMLSNDSGHWVDRSFVYLDVGTNAGLYALEVP